MKQIAELVRHNQGVAASIVGLLVLLAWAFGCESKVESLMVPGKKVSRAELVIEVQSLSKDLGQDPNLVLAQAEVKFAELYKQDEQRKKVFDFAALAAKTGGVDPGGVVALIFSIVGIGAVVDNRIKDKVIKNRPLKEPT